jgi:hypothetical protein
MDRYDEKKDSRDRDDEVAREGDVLGLGGTDVPKAPGDPTASDDPESVRHRRERALSPDDDPRVDREDPYQRGKGATGIQMGAGGSGTDIKPE